jgi:hypothetical protein
MKTEEFETQPADMQAVANDIYMSMLNIEAQKAAAAQMQMEQVAADKGMQGAASNTGAQPDAPSAHAGGSELQTPNQPANQNRPDRR